MRLIAISRHGPEGRFVRRLKICSGHLWSALIGRGVYAWRSRACKAIRSRGRTSQDEAVRQLDLAGACRWRLWALVPLGASEKPSMPGTFQVRCG